jgi:hypothetical protein
MKKEKWTAFTERAMEATDINKLIPPIVYLPRRLRLNPERLTVDNVRLTVAAPTVQENHIRIADADPLGFLIAMMNGQPIPEFRITKDGAIEVHYYISSPQERTSIAQWLGGRVTLSARETKAQPAGTANPDDWDAIVARREQAKVA